MSLNPIILVALQLPAKERDEELENGTVSPLSHEDLMQQLRA